MKVLLLLADGFEDVEALAPRDLLIRSGVEVTTAGVLVKEVMTSHGVRLYADVLLNDINDISGYEALILPGGGRGTQNLLMSKKVDEIVNAFNNNKKLLCAICAAPMVLGKNGLLEGKRFTCFHGCEKGINGLFTAKEVEIDGNIITARSMAYSVPFGLEIISYLLGDEIKNKIKSQIEGLN